MQGYRQKQQYRYYWEGYNAQGELQKGEVDAISLSFAKAQLRKRGITPKKLRQQKRSIFNSAIRAISTQEISLFTRQLATMVRADIALLKALSILAEGTENHELKRVILSIHSDVSDGNMLSTGLRRYPQYFDRLYCALIEAGEQSGTLESMLDRVATYKEKTASIQLKVRKALYYPAAVLIIGFLVMLLLLLQVVPQFQTLYHNFNAELPLITRLVLASSEVIRNWWWATIPTFTLLPILLIWSYRHSERSAYRIDTVTLRLPVFGTLIKQSVIALFARTLATSFAAGVPLISAMLSAAGACGNYVYRNAVISASDTIGTGQPLHIALQMTGLFPTQVTQMIAIGEESGSLETMLNKIADFYEEETDTTLDGMTTLLEPVVITVLGILVGGLVLAMYLPMFKMGSLF